MERVAELSEHREAKAETIELPEVVRDLIADLPPIMSPRTLSEATEYSIAALARWRKTWPTGDCLGPAFSTPPGTNSIRYARLDVARWFASGYSKGTAA